MSYNIGLIGAGRIGAIHAATVAHEPEARLRYVIDPVPEAAERLAERHGAATCTIDEALADADLHGVVIASSTDTHADLIICAAEAGKAIFCEKPVDLVIAKAETCIDAVARAKVPFLLGFNRRFDPHFAKLKNRVDLDHVGTIEMVHITSRDPAPPPVGYIRTSGGMFKDMTIHDLDMARWLLGEEPVEISAAASCLVDPAIGAAGDVDSAVLTLRTAGGKLCVISNSRRADYGYDQRIEVLGSKGMLQAGNVRETEVSLHTASGSEADKIQYFFLERYAAAYAAEMRHFIEILARKCPPRVSGRDGLIALRLAEAAMEAAQSGKTISL